jgi:hypothetical protein
LLESNGVDNLLTPLHKTTPSREVFKDGLQAENGSNFIPNATFNYIGKLNLEFLENDIKEEHFQRDEQIRIFPGQFKI